MHAALVLELALAPADREEKMAPEQWFVCDVCDGSGVHAYRITVYEHGCGFPHDDTAEDPCGKCGGIGGWIGEVEGEEKTDGRSC